MASMETQAKSDNGMDKAENKDVVDKSLVIQQLGRQIEEFFSEENLQNDPQLRSHMTEDGYIDISVLMNANLIKTLSNDRDLIIESIRNSKKLKMNSQETMVRAVPSSERRTLILRDMPPGVTKEEISQIFAHAECGSVKEVHPDIGNTWFVKFNSEEECLKTVKYLQQHGNFRNKPLHVRVKSSNLDKSFPVGKPPVPMLGQIRAEEANLDHLPMPMETLMNPDIHAYDVSRFYDDPNSSVYDPYYLEEDPIHQGVLGGAMEYDTLARRSELANAGIVAAGKRTQGNGLGTSGSMNKSTLENQQQTSDYPGSFLFYDKETFLKVFKQMDLNTDLTIPSSMAGRDQRVISEDILKPISFEEELEKMSNVKDVSVQETKKDIVPREEVVQTSHAPDSRGGRGQGKDRRGPKEGRTNRESQMPTNRSYPQNKKQQPQTQFEARRDRTWNKNNRYMRHAADITIYKSSIHTNKSKRPKQETNVSESAKKPTVPPMALRWVVAGSEKHKNEQEINKPKKNKEMDTNRQSQSSRGPKYVPKVTQSQQIYRPKMQPTS